MAEPNPLTNPVRKVRVPLIVPDWKAPFRVRAVTTTRAGGVSEGDWARFNLATHVGDNEVAVIENRRRLRVVLGLPEEPCWLKQAHTNRVLALPRDDTDQEADAAITDEPGVICAVLTADCVPVLLCDDEGGQVAVIHAGWRGIASGVVEATVAAFSVAPGHLLAWMGPAIGSEAYEVGAEVREALLVGDPAASGAFQPALAGCWRANLYALVGRRLMRAGVTRVHGGTHCAFTDERRFFSHRRDGTTGRQATLIWLEGAQILESEWSRPHLGAIRQD
ncbi:MAG: peptidoglycan editing factor PgeF [Gammaproteobacteria bacterium]|nr:MAG: peptidoglycan editing factor PgeF [Gammaproteobacteria bacterium]